MTEYEKMISGQMYNPLDKHLMKLRQSAREQIYQFNTSKPKSLKKRTKILKKLFGSTGKNIYIEPNLRVDYGCNIHVGENFYANFDCIILDVAPVRIGKNCMLAPNVKILTATHPIDAQERISGIEYAQPITIGDNCWLGAGAMILPNVSLGNNVVVAAGAVVTRSFGDNVVIGGCPARVLRELNAE